MVSANGVHKHTEPEKVAIIGSGNWGSAIAKIVGQNVLRHSEIFEENVPIWVFEETVDGRKLTEIFNSEHENVKYLPGIKIPSNVVATPDLLEAVRDATALVFVLPHHFINKICCQLKGHVNPNARAISLIKGVDTQNGNISILADYIQKELGISTSALSGANIADEVAREAFSETTIGCRNMEEGKMWKALFDTPKFKVSIINDVHGVSLCGALKNVIAMAAGFADGLGWGNNAKAAIMRIGLLEMKKFSQEFFDDVKDETFLQESAGLADLITTCLGGRNRKVAEAYVKTRKPFEELEKELLNGQKLQGYVTAQDIYTFLHSKGKEDEYPLLLTVYRICFEGLEPEKLTDNL